MTESEAPGVAHGQRDRLSKVGTHQLIDLHFQGGGRPSPGHQAESGPSLLATSETSDLQMHYQ